MISPLVFKGFPICKSPPSLFRTSLFPPLSTRLPLFRFGRGGASFEVELFSLLRLLLFLLTPRKPFGRDPRHFFFRSLFPFSIASSMNSVLSSVHLGLLFFPLGDRLSFLFLGPPHFEIELFSLASGFCSAAVAKIS